MPDAGWDTAAQVKLVLEGLQGRSETSICAEHGVRRTDYRVWRRDFLQNLAAQLETDPPLTNGATLFAALGGQGGSVPQPLDVAQELIEALPVPVFFKARDGKYLGVNKAWETFFGVARASFVGKLVHDLYPQSPSVAEKHYAMDQELWAAPGSQSYEIPVTARDGNVRYTIYYKATYCGRDGDVAGLIGTIIDITERKRAEHRQTIEHTVIRLLSESATIAEAMPGILSAVCETLDWACAARWSLDETSGLLKCEETWAVKVPEITAYMAASGGGTYTPAPTGLIRRVMRDKRPVWIPDVSADETFLRGRLAAKAGLRTAFALPIVMADEPLGAIEFYCRDQRAPDPWMLELGAAVGHQVGQFIARRQAERELRRSEERFRSLTNLSSDWYWEQDDQYRFTAISGGILTSSGMQPGQFIGKKRWDSEAVGMTSEDWAAHRALLDARLPFHDLEYGRLEPNGRMRYLTTSGEPVFDEAGRFTGYRGIGRDITSRKQAQAELHAAHTELARKAQELSRSNAELEQFAYVASHDLQEPLRMIGSYTQLLARRYGEKFDDDAREFMHFIVDGAARMKQLIEDLLAYSRVGTRGKDLKPVQLDAVLDRALLNLRGALEQGKATVTRDPLPEVSGDETQMLQLFQNLIGNALKFKGGADPQVHIACKDAGAEWELAVRDNGIGIDKAYYERIFMVFQRLHTREEYAGTGIGLAICKKVVERHGGRIWVEAEPGQGSSFLFTLPKPAKVGS